MTSKRGKRENVTGVLFNRNVFDKSGTVDEKIKYIESIIYESGQVKHDIDYLKTTGPIYIMGGPSAYEKDKINELTDYIYKESIQLVRACTDTLTTEEGVIPPEDDAGGKQDHELRIQNIKKVRADVEETKTEAFRILNEVVQKNKECRDAIERERETRPPVERAAGGMGINTLKVIDSLKPLSNLKHTATCFEFNSWFDQAEAWSESSNFAVATTAVQKVFFPASSQ